MRGLPEATARLLGELDRLPGVDELVLGGGTALALHIAHRRSEDLDFVFAAQSLPRRRIKALLDRLREHHDVHVMPNVAAEHDFMNAGLTLADYHQDYSVDGVKLSFIVPDPASLIDALSSTAGMAQLSRIRVLTLDSLFLMKSITLNNRVMIRDLYDIYVLVEQYGYAPAAVFEAAERHGHSPDALKQRLLAASKRRDDPGLETLVNEPPTFEQLKSWFASRIDRIEQDAASAFARGQGRFRE